MSWKYCLKTDNFRINRKCIGRSQIWLLHYTEQVKLLFDQYSNIIWEHDIVWKPIIYDLTGSVSVGHESEVRFVFCVLDSLYKTCLDSQNASISYIKTPKPAFCW